MSEVSIIGLDIAKHVFQAHGADASGRAALRKKLSRSKVLSFFASQPRCRVSGKAELTLVAPSQRNAVLAESVERLASHAKRTIAR